MVMRQHRTRRSRTALLLLAFAAACGGDKPAADAAAEAAEAEAAPSREPATGTSAAPAALSNAPLEVADIDRWEKGMAGELEAVTAAAEKMKVARTGEDSMSAMMAVQET